MNILVIIAGLIVIVSSLGGYRRGFFRTALTMCSFILAMLIVSVVNPIVTSVLADNVRGTVDKVVSDVLEQKKEEAIEDMGGFLEDFSDELALPGSWENALEKLDIGDVYDQLGVDEAVDSYVSHYTRMILKSISYFISLLIASIIMRVLVMVTDIAAGLPILSGLNRLAGLGLGLLRGIVILWILGLVIAVCSGSAWASPLVGMIKESGWLTFLYKNNLLARLLLPIFG